MVASPKRREDSDRQAPFYGSGCTLVNSASAYSSTISASHSILTPRVRVCATGQYSWWIASARSASSRLPPGTRIRYFTRTRVSAIVPLIFSISPTTSASSFAGCDGIPRASSAPPRVPVSHPPAAATT